MSRSVFVFLIIAMLAAATFAQRTRNTYALVMDNTGSLRTQLPFEKSLAIELVKHAARGGSPVGIYQFEPVSGATRAQAVLGREWSDQEDELLAHVRSISTVQGQTMLIDAMKLAGEHMIARGMTERIAGDKILVVITDGEDRASKTKKNELLRVLNDGQIKVYAVGLVTALPKDRGMVGRSAQDKGKNFLKDLAKATGGRVVFPKDKQTAAAIVAELFGAGEASPK